ncbi:MAG TPA: hypothetical protein VGD55_05035 [Acidothermaceae bacterium]
MEHVVFFPAPDGTPAFRRFATLDDAARFVEHLRNVENVSGASVHALTEVPLAFKAWYRVELPDAVSEPLATEASSEEPSAPTTIAEVLESYAATDVLPNNGSVELPEAMGSVTGIMVPEREGSSPAPIALSQAADQSLFSQPVPEPERAEAQVLEPAFGTRRERGTGYFVR